MVNSENEDGRSTESAFDNTRRQFVAGTAGAIGGLALGSGIVAPSLAQEDGDDDEEEEDDPIQNEFEDDIAILNYALTLERLEARFYEEGLENISEEDFARCEYLGPEDSELRARALDELETIQAHEEEHAATLEQTIVDLGGEPAERVAFDFGVRTQFPAVFLHTAVQFEDLGVAAYAGAAPFIQNEDLVAPALGIHSVEARHASFLRTLTNQTSFPNTFDEAMSRSEVLAVAGQFIDEDAEPPAEDSEGGDDETDAGTGDDETGDEVGGEGDDSTDNGGGGNETSQ